jgi:hypothetical protein
MLLKGINIKGTMTSCPAQTILDSMLKIIRALNIPGSEISRILFEFET